MRFTSNLLYPFVPCLWALALVSPCDARPTDEMGARIGAKRLSIAAEGDHTCFVRADGNVLCWGNNASGQIGDATSGNTRNLPTLVVGITTAVAVAAGVEHTCALLATGAVRCWGSNTVGQLGVGATTGASSIPVAVPNLSGVVSIAAGSNHTCARLANATVRCWGLNTFGRLGDGTTTSPRFTPVAVSGLSDAVKVAAGATHTCALRGGGVVSCWGGNGQGQLGNGNTTDRSQPQTVVDVFGATEIAAGLRFTCAVRAGGDVLCWGDNDLAQLGDSTISDRSIVAVPTTLRDREGRLTPAIDVAAGQTHACAAVFDSDLVLKCWGGNDAGQAGVGLASLPIRFPATVFGPQRPLEMAGGRRHGCALRANDAVVCWGENGLGQLGNGSNVAQVQPVQVLGVSGSIAARTLGIGINHSCAIRSEGVAACWGRNDGRQIGDGTFTDRLVATAVASPGAPWVSIVGGGEHSCGATDDRARLRCWGDNRAGQVDPDLEQDFAPVPHTLSLAQFPVALAEGSSHGCTADKFSSTSCRGSNSRGQLSTSIVNDAFEDRISPSTVAVAAGGAHSCALRGDGSVACWGFNDFGQLGDGTRNSTSVVREVAGITNAVSLSSTRDHACALLATGVVVCWGRNDFGQVDGTLGGDRLIPTPVATLAPGAAVAVTTGFQHSCILTPAGTVRCWGRNNEGQLGNNTVTDSVAPVTVLRSAKTPSTLTGVVGLVSDAAHNCALLASGQPVCWGRNPEGQLGDGTRTRRLMAVGAGSFTANIARLANVSASNRIATVTALINCADGERFKAEITVTQGSVTGHGRINGACTGGLSSHPLVVPAQGRDAFSPGAAIARAEITVHSHGEVTDEQEWTRSIELVP